MLAGWWTENTNHVVSAWIAKLFERRQEIPRERSRLAKLSSTSCDSKGRRIPWSVGYQGGTGKDLMKTKMGTEGRRKAYASTSVSASSPREISDRAGCLFAGRLPRSRNFPPDRKRRWKTRVGGLSLSFSSPPAARHSGRGKSTLELNLFLAT